MGLTKFSTLLPAHFLFPTELPNSQLNHGPQIGSPQLRSVHKHALTGLRVIKFDKMHGIVLTLLFIRSHLMTLGKPLNLFVLQLPHQ